VKKTIKDLHRISVGFGHEVKRPVCVIEFKDGSKDVKDITDPEVSYNYDDLNITSLRPNKKHSWHDIEAGDNYQFIRELIESPIIESHTAKKGDFPGSAFSVKIYGLDPSITFVFDKKENQEPFYQLSGNVPWHLLQWLDGYLWYTKLAPDHPDNH
jgi:hypothetical protein